MRPFLRVFATAFFLLSMLLSGEAGAQLRTEAAPAPIEGPPDVSLERNLTIPPLPADFVRESAGTLTFEMPPDARDAMRPVIDSAATEWLRITGDLGADAVTPVLVRVGRNPDEMAALAPLEAPPPEYAVGVAYPALDLVLLTLVAPETWERPPVRQVFAHELAHVALHRAVTGERIEDPWSRAVPRWFDEGVAIHAAGERSIERVETLWQGTISNQIIPLDRLDRGFPSRPHAVNLAYAESADFVAWLLRRSDDGPTQLRTLLSRVRGGDTFEQAVSITFTASLGQLEDEWHTALGERYGAGPLLLGSGLAWGFVAILIVLAFRKRRANTKTVLARWTAEEKIEDEREALRARAREILLARRAMDEQVQEERAKAAAAGPAPAESSEPDDDEEAPPPRIQPEVPSIEYEGDRHTLH